MKGVMIPGDSAGSNQVGAKVTWTAQVNVPSDAAETGEASRTEVRIKARMMAPRMPGVRLLMLIVFLL
jgi:hypothetical protein